MHVLLCVVDDASDDRADDHAGGRAALSLPEILTSVWRRSAPHCSVEHLLLPAAAAAAEPSEPSRPPAGVFVPLSELGLTTSRDVVPPEIAELGARVARTDLVVVALPVLDGGTLHEGPVAAAAQAAAPHALPVVLVAGRVEVSRREWSAAGISGVHELELDDDAAMSRVVRTWAPGWTTDGRPGAPPM